jgi:hypothetical protein
MTSALERPTASFTLSLLAGLLILAGSGTMGLFSAAPYYGMMGGYFGMMGGYYGTMQGYGYGGWFHLLVVIGMVSGVAVLLGAFMLYNQPGKVQTWGAVVLAFSIVSFIGMGGFFLGAILGIVGGVLAIVWRPEVAPR